MDDDLSFPEQEYDGRVAKLRQEMEARSLHGCVITSPEDIYYLTGLDYQGYFATHFLVVPAQDEMLLITRAHESRTIAYQVGNVRFHGYSETEDAGNAAAALMKKHGLAKCRIGLQMRSLYCPPAYTRSLMMVLDRAHWEDISDLVEGLRLVKSSREVELIRRAAKVSCAMIEAAIEVGRAGTSEREIAAEVHRAMLLHGGDVPGFGPFIRSTPTLHFEHMLWSDHRLEVGDTLLLELSGCVRRYHAPMGRFMHIGRMPAGTEEVAALCLAAQRQVVAMMRPGVTGSEIYSAWQDVINDAGLHDYRRPHCGYAIGIGFPPTWTGGVGLVSLHPDSRLVLEASMVFHQLSWLLGCDKGDFFISDTVVVTQSGSEFITEYSREPFAL